MKNKILSFFMSRVGAMLKQPIVGLVSFIAVFVAKYTGYVMSDAELVLYAATLHGIILAALDRWVNGTVGDGVKKIQTIEGVKVDAVPGPVTVAAVKETSRDLSNAQHSLRNGGRGA